VLIKKYVKSKYETIWQKPSFFLTLCSSYGYYYTIFFLKQKDAGVKKFAPGRRKIRDIKK
jgi:hypothetical protein